MNVTIRPLEENDAYTSVKWRNIPELWLHTASAPDHEITIDEELAWIRKVIADDSSRRFAIMADDVYVGNIYLTGIENGSAEYHIFIGDQEYWGKGIARKASELIIEFAREELKLSKVTLAVKQENAGAYHLYESMGFIKTGIEGEFTQMELVLE